MVPLPGGYSRRIASLFQRFATVCPVLENGSTAAIGKLPGKIIKPAMYRVSTYQLPVFEDTRMVFVASPGLGALVASSGSCRTAPGMIGSGLSIVWARTNPPPPPPPCVRGSHSTTALLHLHGWNVNRGSGAMLVFLIMIMPGSAPGT